MRIYRVLAYVILPLEDEEEDYNVNAEEVDESQMEDDEQVRVVDLDFYLGASDLDDVFMLAKNHITEAFPDNEYYEVLELRTLQENGNIINVVNWGECNCPFCRANLAAPEDLIIFHCSCGEEIKVADGWKQIECPKCNKIILRDKVIDNGKGGYFFVDVE